LDHTEQRLIWCASMRKISPPLQRLDRILRRIVSTPKVDIERIMAEEERKKKDPPIKPDSKPEGE
jgi:hypothetical protein